MKVLLLCGVLLLASAFMGITADAKSEAMTRPDETHARMLENDANFDGTADSNEVQAAEEAGADEVKEAEEEAAENEAAEENTGAEETGAAEEAGAAEDTGAAVEKGVEESKHIPDGVAAIMLVTSLCLVFTLYYLVNCRSAAIVKSSWGMIATAVSIFLAVLIYDDVNDVFSLIFQLPPADEDDSSKPPGFARTHSRGVQMICWWIFAVIVLYFRSHSVLHTKTYGLISGHILGFAGINYYGYLASDDPYRNSPWWDLLIFVYLGITFALMFAFSMCIGKCLKKTMTDEEADRWHDQAQDTGTDFLNMTSGYLFSFFLRYWITGELPSIDGDLGINTASEQVILTLVGTVLLVVTAVLIGQHAKADEGSFKEKAFACLTGCTSNAAAFCILFGFMWTVKMNNGVMGRVVVAICCTLASIVYILAAGYIYHIFPGVSSKVLKAAFTSIALIVALSWEKLFDETMDALGDTLSEETGGDVNAKRIMLIFLEWFMLLLIWPAWCVFIYVKTDEEVQKAYSHELAKGPLPPRAAFVDYDLANDYDPDEYESDEEGSYLE